MVELLANSGDPYQMPCSAMSDLGLHCLQITLLGVSRLQQVYSSGFSNQTVRDLTVLMLSTVGKIFSR